MHVKLFGQEKRQERGEVTLRRGGKLKIEKQNQKMKGKNCERENTHSSVSGHTKGLLMTLQKQDGDIRSINCGEMTPLFHKSRSEHDDCPQCDF